MGIRNSSIVFVILVYFAILNEITTIHFFNSYNKIVFIIQNNKKTDAIKDSKYI